MKIGRVVRAASWLCALFMLLADRPAQAQSEGSVLAAARERFEHGMQAMRDGRWRDARDAFQRSYDLSHRPVVLVNLATAQAQAGQLVEATETYRRFLTEASGRQLEAQRASVEAALAELSRRLPHAMISVTGLTDADQILIDGGPVPSSVQGVALPLNPGLHTFRVAACGASRCGERANE